MAAAELQIRDAEGSDRAGIVAIYNHEVRNEITTFDTVPWEVDRDGLALVDRDARYPLIVARLGTEVVGWGSLSRWSPKGGYDRCAEISVYVRGDARQGGVGRTLIEELVARAGANGIASIISRIAGENPASVRLHESAGFKPIGTQHACGEKFGRVLDVTLMELVLG